MNSEITFPPPPILTTVVQQERIAVVDVLRGVAVLGILLMNIVSFGLAFHGGAPTETAINGGNTRANLTYWFVSQVLFEGKMRALFSMLFGASAALLIRRAEERGSGLRAADVFYRRTMWLILFGVLHAYFLWAGDILYAYGVFGLFLFPLRNAKPKWLLAAGLALMLLGGAKGVWAGYDILQLRERAATANRLAAEGKTLTEEQKAAQKQWEAREKNRTPDQEKIKKELDTHRGGYGKLFVNRMKLVTEIQSSMMYRNLLYDVAGMMLVGMALLLSGVLTGARSAGFYLKLMLCGYVIGGAINAAVGWYGLKTGFGPESYMLQFATYDIGRLLVALAHASLVMLLVKNGWLRRLTARLAAVGQTALSGYLATSVICSTLFYGYGFGLFGKLQRYQLLYVVLAVWVFLLIAAPIWLRHFRYGPMEWVWRSLTHWRKQPMRLIEKQAVPQLEPSAV